MKTHHDLDLWKKAIELVTIVYKVTNGFPQSEIYGLTNQIRRSAISIPSNVAEGAARKSPKEFMHFLSIAKGSAAELETQLIISKNLGFIDDVRFKEVDQRLVDLRKMLSGLSRSIEKRSSEQTNH